MKFLIRFFIKDSENIQNPKVREKYSVLSGITGIILNLVLFLVKLISGIITGSVAIEADAFNNLSDCGSSVVSIAASRLSNRRPDKDHPFGHGRYEYIASLVVSFLIIFMGLEFFKGSVGKIIAPEPIVLSPVILFILILTIFVKLWMFSYNNYISKKISSSMLIAAARDSLNDSIATATTIIAAFFAQYTNFPVDGIVGLLVSVFIMYGGLSLAKDTIGTLLGSPASAETFKQIENIIMSEPEISGMHDLIIHDYGPGRTMASVHAEVSDKADIVKIHEVIDALELKINQETGINLVIHMDPISTDCEITNTLKVYIKDYLTKNSPVLSFHDLRITGGENNINIIFDLVMPADYTIKMQQKEVAELRCALCSLNPKYNVVINVDTPFVN